MSLVSYFMYIIIYIYVGVGVHPFALVQLDEYFASNRVLQFVLGGCCSQPWHNEGDMGRYPMKCGNVGEDFHDSLANFGITLFSGGKKKQI